MRPGSGFLRWLCATLILLLIHALRASSLSEVVVLGGVLQFLFYVSLHAHSRYLSLSLTHTSQTRLLCSRALRVFKKASAVTDDSAAVRIQSLYGIQPFETNWQKCMNCLTDISAYSSPALGKLAWQTCTNPGKECHVLSRSVSNGQERRTP